MSTQSGDGFDVPTILYNTPDEHRAAVEFYLKARVTSPLKSWFKAHEIADATGLSTSQAGQAMRAIAVDPEADLDVSSRSGHRTTAWQVQCHG